MLGRFLEFSIPTPDIRASLDFYGRLGFSQAQVGEAWAHPYAVVTDGRICISACISSFDGRARAHLRQARRAGSNSMLSTSPVLVFEYRKLGNDVFNELGWLDPSGHLIRLIEARTFSPSQTPRATSLCGYFLEIALPAPRPRARQGVLGAVRVRRPGRAGRALCRTSLAPATRSISACTIRRTCACRP